MVSNLLQKVLVSTTVGTVIGFSTIFGAVNSASAALVGSIQTPVKQAISHVVFYLKDSSGNIAKVKVDNFSTISDNVKIYDPTGFLQNKYPNSEVVAYEVKAGNKSYFTSTSAQYSERNLPINDKTVEIQYKDVYQIQPIQIKIAPTAIIPPIAPSVVTPPVIPPIALLPEPTPVAPPVVTPPVAVAVVTPPVAVAVVTPPVAVAVVTPPIAPPVVTPLEIPIVNSTTIEQPTPIAPLVVTPPEIPIVNSTTIEQPTLVAPLIPPVTLLPVPTSKTNFTKSVSVPEPGSMAAIVIFGLAGLLGKKKISR